MAHTSGIGDHQYFRNINEVDGSERLLHHLRENTAPGGRTRQVRTEKWDRGALAVSHG